MKNRLKELDQINVYHELFHFTPEALDFIEMRRDVILLTLDELYTLKQLVKELELTLKIDTLQVAQSFVVFNREITDEDRRLHQLAKKSLTDRWQAYGTLLNYPQSQIDKFIHSSFVDKVFVYCGTRVFAIDRVDFDSVNDYCLSEFGLPIKEGNNIDAAKEILVKYGLEEEENEKTRDSKVA